jgi:SAM-dependent methyltransferase
MEKIVMSALVGQSRYWKRLWQRYWGAPSLPFCRVPELEYASALRLDGRSLDHCCGDGYFATQAWPGQRFTAGCDMDAAVLKRAEATGQYGRLDCCDAGKQLPYEDGAFDLVFNNSGLEHVRDLDRALAEIARVLRPGGALAFNVLGRRYFDWWPFDRQALTDYCRWQPFYHALSLEEWRQRLDQSGLEIAEVRGYFDRPAAQALAYLDYEFSGYYLDKRPSKLVKHYYSRFGIRRWLWRRRITRVAWQTAPDAGAGFAIVARKRA